MRSVLLLVAAAAPWAILGACSFDWDGFDPRLAGVDAGLDSSSEASSTVSSSGVGASAGNGGQGGMAGSGGSGGSVDTHVTRGLVALYTLEEGSGVVVNDVSGVGSPLDLSIADPANATWIDGGLDITASTIVSSAGPATKIVDACKTSGELTVEVWFVPDNLTQGGPARIVTNSVDSASRNFTLAQQAATSLVARFRTDGADGGVNGYPYMSTPATTVKLALTHLLFTRDAGGARHVYVDGVDEVSDVVAGALSSWDETFVIALANEITLDRSWLGELHRVAIYDRALTPAEVAQNFNAGP